MVSLFTGMQESSIAVSLTHWTALIGRRWHLYQQIVRVEFVNHRGLSLFKYLYHKF